MNKQIIFNYVMPDFLRNGGYHGNVTIIQKNFRHGRVYDGKSILWARNFKAASSALKKKSLSRPNSFKNQRIVRQVFT